MQLCTVDYALHYNKHLHCICSDKFYFQKNTVFRFEYSITHLFFFDGSILPSKWSFDEDYRAQDDSKHSIELIVRAKLFIFVAGKLKDLKDPVKCDSLTQCGRKRPDCATLWVLHTPHTTSSH